MATRLFFRDTQTEPGTGGIVHDLLTAQGTTAPLGSGNTSSATFVEMRRFQRDVGVDVEGTSFPISINMASVSASTLEWQAIVQRLNSSNVVQAESTILGPFNTAGIKTGTLTLSTTWVAGDRLAVSLQLRKTSGGGNRSFSLNVNDVDTYADATLAGAVTVTPGTASLATTNFIPTVTVSDNQTVTPGVVNLTTTLFVPVVTASDNKTVTPGIATLTTTLYIPVVTVGGSVVVTPGTASLTTTRFTPSVILGTVLIPGVGSLTTTRYTPVITISDNQTVTPGTLALTLTRFTPSIILGTVVTPNIASLILTRYTPTVTATTNVTVTPGTVALITTLYASSVIIGTILTLGTVSLILTTFVPIITVSQNVLVVPGLAIWSITAYIPLVLLHTAYGSPFLWTAANWGSVSVFLEVYMRATSGTVYARLIDDDGSPVANSEVTTTSSSFTRLRSSAITLANTKAYRVQLAKDGGGEFLGARLVMTPS